MNRSSGNAGAPVAIRGYLIQTLVALLEIVEANPPFTAINLEPGHSNEQFDFSWTDGRVTHAVQVKSTQNKFNRRDVENWAAKMEASRSSERCRLTLVGACQRNLQGLSRIGSVTIETKSLTIEGLFKNAAHRVAVFAHSHQLDAGKPEHHILIVESLVTRLLRHSITREPISHQQFVSYLRQWVAEAPRPLRKIEISIVDRYAPDRLIGRHHELKLISNAWERAMRGETERPHVLTFVAAGGEGKTSVVAKWAARMAHQHWPGCEVAFGWSFHSQGSGDQMAASADLFIRQALVFFGDQQMADSPGSGYEKGKRLAHLVGQHRAILLLDGLEPLQFPPSSPIRGQLKDHGIAVLLRGLAANSHGLCIVTTRSEIPDLRVFWETTAPQIPLRRLTPLAGKKLLRHLGTKGREHEFETLVEEVKGHALTLNLIGSYLRDAHGGDIRKRGMIDFHEADAENGGQAFRVMSAYASWFLQDEQGNGCGAHSILLIIGLFDRPIDMSCFNALVFGPKIEGLTDFLFGLHASRIRVMLNRLEAANLLFIDTDGHGNLASVDSHSLVRDYFGTQLRANHPAAWQAAHERIFRHLVAVANVPPSPNLEDLDPLYHSIVHGCAAGLFFDTRKDILCDRIQCDDAYISTKQLGGWGLELGALSQFFEVRWSAVTPQLPAYERGLILSQTQLCLRSLGRLREAKEPLAVALSIREESKDYFNAAICAFNMAALHLCLGSIEAAIVNCQISIRYADESKDVFLRLYARSMLADALLAAGRLGECAPLFCEAEKLQLERPGFPSHLTTLPGFCYCDFLAGDVNRATWKRIMSPEGPPSDSHWTILADIDGRASGALYHTQKTTKNKTHVGLDMITLARIALYQFVLGGSSSLSGTGPDPSTCLDRAYEFAENALSNVRAAGMEEYMPLALLTRAWIFATAGCFTGSNSCQEDLDEAWEIANREPMPLFLAEIHLSRARLFFKRETYPWKSAAVDLIEARRIIQKHGYGRRRLELEDAECVIL